MHVDHCCPQELGDVAAAQVTSAYTCTNEAVSVSLASLASDPQSHKKLLNLPPPPTIWRPLPSVSCRARHLSGPVPYRCCRCAGSISPAYSSATGPGACSCRTADTASSNQLLWKRSGGCSPRLHKTALRPWSCTSCTCTHTHIEEHKVIGNQSSARVRVDACARTHTHTWAPERV